VEPGELGGGHAMPPGRLVARLPQQAPGLGGPSPDLFPAGVSRRHAQVATDGLQRAERSTGVVVRAQLELDFPQHRPGRAGGGVHGEEALRCRARLHEPVPAHEARREHLKCFLVAAAPQCERTAGMLLCADQVGVGAAQAGPLEVQPRQLGVIPRGERVACDAREIEGQIELEHVGLRRPRRRHGRHGP
jgi:hypothetical protein